MYFYGNHISNVLNKNRFKNFGLYFNHFLKLNNTILLYDNNRFLNYYRDFYYQLFIENIDLCLLFFFLKKNIIINLYNNKLVNKLNSFINADFIYRYYTFTMLMEFDYYRD